LTNLTRPLPNIGAPRQIGVRSVGGTDKMLYIGDGLLQIGIYRQVRQYRFRAMSYSGNHLWLERAWINQTQVVNAGIEHCPHDGADIAWITRLMKHNDDVLHLRM
jgi:hypothetical protein